LIDCPVTAEAPELLKTNSCVHHINSKKVESVTRENFGGRRMGEGHPRFKNQFTIRKFVF
jgi:hypothetical protein